MTDELFIKRERDEARLLRKSSWWQNKINSNCRCYYCDKPLKKAEVTMDHVVPLTDGGRSVKTNLVPCCKDCNNKKKHMSMVEWHNYLSLLRGHVP